MKGVTVMLREVGSGNFRPRFKIYPDAEIDLERLIKLVDELRRSKIYNGSLLGRVEEELGRLCKYVRLDSNTAQAYSHTINWGEIGRAAREDFYIYGAGVYFA